MNFNFEEYHKFMEDNVLSQIGITYNNLIEKGLAIEAPEGMYKED